MSAPRFIDTNVFIRFFTQDDAEKADLSRRLLDRVADGQEVVVMTHLVVSEIVFLLQKFYRTPRPEITGFIELLLAMRAVRVPDRDHLLEALKLYEDRNISFVDAYNAVYMQRNAIGEIYSWDSDFNSRAPGVVRVEPG